MINGHLFIGIISGRASEHVQQTMLKGIISQAEKYGMYTAVISNIYNFFKFKEYFGNVEVENKIYELIESPRFDGIIFMAETLASSDLEPFILEKLKKLDIPIVVAGDSVEGYTSVNNDIREDFRDIARHLTEVHGFTKIDVLTGQYEIPTSHERVRGVRDVLEEKGIPLTENNIMYGDFWTTSGEKFAMEYVSGKRPLPEAVICANDYMAFGFMDKMFENDVKVGRDLTVVGYEYAGERMFHQPILSTFLRNRYSTGAKAVSILNSMITGRPAEEISVKGCMVTGDSCSCGCEKKYLMSEWQEVRTVQFYNSMTMCGNFEQKLAQCRSLGDYIRALQDYAYLIHDLEGLYLCLYENWTNRTEVSDLYKSSNDEIMTMYRIISPVQVSSEPHGFTRKMLFPDELYGAGDKRFLYFVPMFTCGIEIGYFIFQYIKPECYDPVIIGWINSAVNALNVIRMKNDINELLEYNNLSAFRDTATGLYNRDGFIRELDNMIAKADKGQKISAVLIKTRIFSDESRFDEKSLSVRLDTETAECLKKLAVDNNAVCARLSERHFVYAMVGELSADTHEIVADRLTALIAHSPVYKESNDTDSIISSGDCFDAGDITAEAVLKALSEDINRRIEDIFNSRKRLNSTEFLNVRNSLYRVPEKRWDAESVCRDLNLSCGHFRAEYKNIFGISFHRDVIRSRISLAKYLLMTTSLSLPAVAMRCGYDDDKYFLRQFRQQTGISPNSYRRFELS